MLRANGKVGVFQQGNDGFACPESSAEPHSAFWVIETTPKPFSDPPKWQDRRIVRVQVVSKMF
jgi:hypothetical protein